MESLMMVYGNAVSEEKYEEMNFWYTWCHVSDELTNSACLACQRFELSKYQPRNADTLRKVLTIYEVMDRDYCNRWHAKDAFTWRMRIAVTLSDDYYETHWNPLWGTSHWAEYADYRGDKAVFSIKLKAKPERMDPRDYFTVDKLKEIRCLPGFHALHFFDWHPEHQMPANTPPPEYADYNLVCQISNCYMVANEWNKYLDEHPEIEESFEMFPAIFEPMMPRIRDVDIHEKPEYRALQAIAHMIQEDKDGRILPIIPESEKEASQPEHLKDYVNIERRSFRDDHTKG